jgi:hypothetical protein
MPAMTKSQIAILEEVSNIQHEIWSHWMTYLFRESSRNEDGSFTIPVDKVMRWKRQIDTPYAQLTDNEKKSDREQAEKVLNTLRKCGIDL